MIYLHSYKLLFSSNYNAFNAEKFNGSGIYCAYGLVPSSKFLQPIYIGSAVNLKRRLLDGHITELKHNKHKHNDLLQRYYNDNGPENLIWILLEETNKENTREREQFWLDTVQPFADELRGFNFAKNAVSPWAGKKISEEHKKNISIGLQGKAGKSDEWRKKMSIRMKGKILTQKELDHLAKMRKLIPKPTKETKEKMSKSHSGNKNHFFGKRHSPETIAIIKEKNTGKPGFWKGKTLDKDAVAKMAEKHEKEYNFINPKGELVKIKNLKKFCEQNNLKYHAMNDVFHHRNRMKSHCGWKRVE